jgi:hypothetical protein
MPTLTAISYSIIIALRIDDSTVPLYLNCDRYSLPDENLYWCFCGETVLETVAWVSRHDFLVGRNERDARVTWFFKASWVIDAPNPTRIKGSHLRIDRGPAGSDD